jgi:hypothetical protein
MATTLAGTALVGDGPLETSTGFALARRCSYATGWVPRERVPLVARALGRWTGARVRVAARELDRRAVYRARVAGVEEAFEKLRTAYATAARRKAGVFVELVICS